MRHARKKSVVDGTCEDAQSQCRCFCDRGGFKDDINVDAPIAGNHAKRDMAAACDGVSVEDFAFEFEDGTPVK